MSWYKGILLSIFIASSLPSGAADLLDAQEMAYQQKLDHHMQMIDRTKLVLDAQEITATPSEQQQALCERLNAYREIVLLGDEFAELAQAQSMKRVAQFYLNQQSASFQHAGIALEQWCTSK